MRHLLSVDDVTGDELLGLLDRADELKAERAARLRAQESLVGDELRGRSVALLFEKPSLRTRASFEVGVHELGGKALPMWDSEVGLGRRETIEDTGAVLGRYVHAIVIRTFGQDDLERLAAAAGVPVVNALTDHEHPCQALADLQTFREVHGGFDGRVLTYIGDGNNVAHSLLLAGAKAGLSIRIAHPEGYGPDESVVARAQQLAAQTGAEVTTTTDPRAASEGAHALYTDVWASMGQESEAAERARRFAPFQLTPALLSAAADDAVVLHCLPAHRGEEIAAEVIDSDRARIFDQAENRLHAQKALLATLLP